MAPLLFTCPKTNQKASTGIETDPRSLSACWKTTLTVNCIEQVKKVASVSRSPKDRFEYQKRGRAHGPL
jgi:hypothetical protein